MKKIYAVAVILACLFTGCQTTHRVSERDGLAYAKKNVSVEHVETSKFTGSRGEYNITYVSGLIRNNGNWPIKSVTVTVYYDKSGKIFAKNINVPVNSRDKKFFFVEADGVIENLWGQGAVKVEITGAVLDSI